MLIANPPVSPVGQRIPQPPASLPIEDVVKINNGHRPSERSCPCIHSRHHSRASLRSKRFRRFEAFLLFEHAKLGARAESVLRSPQFSPRQKAKNATNGRKNLWKRLLRRLLQSRCKYCKNGTPVVEGQLL